MAVVPEVDGGPGLLVRLRQGFLRAGVPSPTFAPEKPASRGSGAGHGGVLSRQPGRGAARPRPAHVTRLEFGPLPDLDAARAILPAWVPELIARPGDEIRFETPDQALVPGPGARVAGDDIASVLTGTPGHRELAVHGPTASPGCGPRSRPTPTGSPPTSPRACCSGVPRDCRRQ